MGLEDILIYLEHCIQIAIKTKQLILVVSLNIKQTFDSCNHRNLLQNGIKARTLKWLTDLFSGRRFNVWIVNYYSDDNPALKGVPQGSILCPLLFSIVMACISSTERVQTLMYTDDLSLFTLADDINLADSRLQHSITNISKWLSEQELSTDKFVYMIFTTKKSYHTSITFYK